MLASGVSQSLCLAGSPRSGTLLKHIINSKWMNFVFGIIREIFAALKLSKC